MCRRATHRSPVADLEMSHVWQGSGQQRARLGDIRTALRHRLAGSGAHGQPAILPTDPRQLRDAIDVDQVVDAGQAQRQQRNQALAPGQHLGSLAELGEQAHRFVQGGREMMFKGGRFHQGASLARPESPPIANCLWSRNRPTVVMRPPTPDLPEVAIV